MLCNARFSYTTPKLYWLGPLATISFINVPVLSPKGRATPSSISASHCANSGLLTLAVVRLLPLLKAYASKISACAPLLEVSGEVWPNLTGPQLSLPPSAFQPPLFAIALCRSYQKSFGPFGHSTFARSSQPTTTSGLITSDWGASAPAVATGTLDMFSQISLAGLTA